MKETFKSTEIINRFKNIKHKPNTTQFKLTPHLRRLRNYGQLTLHNHRIKSLVQSTKKNFINIQQLRISIVLLLHLIPTLERQKPREDIV